MSSRISVLVNIAVVMTFGVAFLEGANHSRSDQVERSILTRQGNRTFPRDNSMSFVKSSPLFFLHLLKKKIQIQKVEKIPTTTPATTTTTAATTTNRICICVPFYQCNANQTIITGGTGVIDVRAQICTGPFEVCCYLPNIITTQPPATTTTTARPTIPPNLNCICVNILLCAPNGIVTISGEGVIDPRFGFCPGTQVCCRILANTTTTTSRPATTTTTTARPTIPPNLNCICVNISLCAPNGIVTISGEGVIDPRFGFCPGTQVCCRILATTTTTTSRPATTSTTTTTTIRPTVPPNLNCICVNISLCAPNGIVTISGEGVIDPRYGLCPGIQVCCRILATTTSPPTTVTTTSTTRMTPIVTPAQIQQCFMCGDTIQCITCDITIAPGVIDPRFSLSQKELCSRSLTNEQLCPDGTISPNVELLGPLKYLGTSQACYCVKTWMCSEGNVVSPDGLGVIDSRFTACPSADQVCCRPMGINLQTPRSSNTFLSSPERFIASNSFRSFSQMICGIQDSSYAPPQPFPADSEKTYFAEFPWMVALLTKTASGSYAFRCGASMINDKAVLTAAHCVINQKPENLMARFGQWNMENEAQPLPTQESNILSIITHPTYYNNGLFHDVAVLVLEKPVLYSANVLPICLPEQGMVFTAGTRCYGTGWGSSSSFGPEGAYQAELRKVNVPIVDHAECQTRLRGTKLGQHFQLHGSFICAGSEANRDTCRGDGGGPLTCQTATGQFLQAGIVSWGIGCGASDVPAVYASVSQHRQWIDKQLATYGVQ